MNLRELYFQREPFFTIRLGILLQISLFFCLVGMLIIFLSRPVFSKPSPSVYHQPITLHFQDIPIRQVLQLMADYQDFNLVVSDSVSGNISLRLREVNWEQALDIILQTKGLDKRINGNVIYIAAQSELDLNDQLQLEKTKLNKELSPLSSELIMVHFAKAQDLAQIISGNSRAGLLSERGNITVDERTNALLISDYSEYLTVIRDIIQSLDIPAKQVQIEARIVSVSEGSLDEMGVRWGVRSSGGEPRISGTIDALLNDAYAGDEDNTLPIDKLLNVNLGVTANNASHLALRIARLGSNALLDLELSALQAESKAEIISSPRLVTTNKQAAYIEQGTDIPYLEAASSGATSVSFKKAVLSLKVTPQITMDNRLILDLSVTQDRPGQVVKTGGGEAIAIDTQRIGTQVLINDGETIVLGGIFQHSITTRTDKVAVLGELPLLGKLFRRDYENIGKSELLIFVTPKILM